MGERFPSQRERPPLTAVPPPPSYEQRHEGPLPEPDLASVRLAEAARRDLYERWRRMRAAAQRVYRRRDGEAIHDARVASRRLSAALRAWNAVLEERRVRRATRALRQLRRRLGEVRDREVMLALVQARVERCAGEEAAAWTPLLVVLASQVERGRERAVRRTRPKRLRSIGRRVRAAANAPRPAIGGAVALEAGLAGSVAEARVRALALLREAGDVEDDERLHAARIAVKKWRYAIEFEREMLPGANTLETRARIKSLAAIQEALGAVHDLAVLRGLLEGTAVPPEREAIVKRLSASIEEERRTQVADARHLLVASWPILSGVSPRA